MSEVDSSGPADYTLWKQLGWWFNSSQQHYEQQKLFYYEAESSVWFVILFYLIQCDETLTRPGIYQSALVFPHSTLRWYLPLSGWIWRTWIGPPALTCPHLPDLYGSLHDTFYWYLSTNNNMFTDKFYTALL